MKLRKLKISDITVTDGNSNAMDPDMLAQLAASMRNPKVGFFDPVLVRERDGVFTLVDGEQRLRAAEIAGLDAVWAVTGDFDADDDELARALRIGANKFRGRTNLAAVGAELQELVDLGWSSDELAITGFELDEIGRLLDASRSAFGEDDLDKPLSEPDDLKPKRYALSVQFETEAERSLARARLLQAAGDGGTLAQGLLAVLGEEETE